MGGDPEVARLEALARKYRTLASLRARREALEALGETTLPESERPARRDAFREVAEEFPGALRELKERTADELRARAVAVESVLAAEGRHETPRWMRVTLDFHEILRDALRSKRDDPSVRSADGRILTFVYDELARRHGGSRRELESEIFGPLTREA